MMNAALFSILLNLAVGQTDGPPQDGPTAPRPVPVFDGTAGRQMPDGTTQQMAVRVQHWIIPSHQGKVTIPITDFYLAQLRAGRARATIDGTTTDRGPGDLWVVKRGASMSVETLSQSAVLETIVATVSR